MKTANKHLVTIEKNQPHRLAYTIKQVISILVIMAVISVSLIEVWILIKDFLADG